MKSTGTQITKSYRQINNAKPGDVFPLLCPVREQEWLDGWEHTMIFSTSGYAEKGCVFSTPHHYDVTTFWYITEYDRIHHRVEFIRVTPDVEIVKLTICLTDNGNETTASDITYQYTPISESRREHLRSAAFDREFEQDMAWWEKSINHYLATGEKLLH